MYSENGKSTKLSNSVVSLGYHIHNNKKGEMSTPLTSGLCNSLNDFQCVDHSSSRSYTWVLLTGVLDITRMGDVIHRDLYTKYNIQ